MDTKTIDRIKALRADAVSFETFHANFAEKYLPNQTCDKKGYGFGADDRFSAFAIATKFSSWAGYYGNSSCSTIMSVRDKELVAPFLIKALNLHQKEIFATVARLMRSEAATLTAKAAAEVEAIQQMLADASSEATEAKQ